MLNHANIEPSGFKVGEYVGYTMAGKTSYLMRIRRGGQGWETYYHEPLSKAAGGCFTYVTARTLKEMSGKTAKEKAQEMGQKLANFKSVVDYLEKRRDHADPR